MCCGGGNSACVTLNKAKCKCSCAKCRHCSVCGRETIGVAGGLFAAGTVGTAVAKFKRGRRTFSVSSDTSESPPENPDSVSEKPEAKLDILHMPTRYSRSAKISEAPEPSSKPLHVPTRYARSVTLSEEPDMGKSRFLRTRTVHVEPDKCEPPPMRTENVKSLEPAYIPAHSKRASTLSKSSSSTDSYGASLGKAADEGCVVQ